MRSLLANAFDRVRRRTIGVDVCYWHNLQLWDTAGIEHFEALEQVTTRNAAIIVLAYSDAASFVAVQQRWYPRACREAARLEQAGFSRPRLVLASLQSDRYGGDEDARDDMHAAYARSIDAVYTTTTATTHASRHAFFSLLKALVAHDSSLPTTAADKALCK